MALDFTVVCTGYLSYVVTTDRAYVHSQAALSPYLLHTLLTQH